MRLLLPSSAMTLAAVLTFTAPALAGDRFAEPGGDGLNPCKVQDPCDITVAVHDAVEGDHIKVLPGTLSTKTAMVVTTSGLTIEPAVLGTRPIIVGTQDEGVFRLEIGGKGQTVIKGLEIRSDSKKSDTEHEPIRAFSRLFLSDVILRSRGQVLETGPFSDGSVVEDVTVEQIAGVQAPAEFTAPNTTIRRLTVTAAVGSGGVIVSDAGTQITDATVTGGDTGLRVLAGALARRVSATAVLGGIVVSQDATVTDSVAAITGAGNALKAVSSNITLRNVTAFGSAVGSVGLLAQGPGTVVNARNLIAEGVLKDVQVAGGANLTLDHSMFTTVDGGLAPGGTANVNVAPAFLNAEAGDLHLAAGSAAIDTGVVDDLIGATDRDGALRVQGAAPDLGAFESTPPVPVPVPAPAPAPAPAPTPEPVPPVVIPGSSVIVTGPVDTVAPKLTALKATAKRGQSARISLTVNEGSSVQVVLQKSQSGKRQGAKCVKATAKLRQAKSCTRLVTLVTTRKTLKAGVGRVTIGSRLDRGRYQITMTAKDAAGNRGKTTTASFTIT